MSSIKRVLITGCSTGIGAHLALAMARKGYLVFASMRDPAAGAKLVATSAREGLSCEALALDVTQQTSVDAAMARVFERCGGVDVLVNNAGVGCSGPVETVTPEAAQATFDVNYFGAMRMIQAVVPGMREQGSGAIINVTSIASRFPTGGSAHYTASKVALEGASECLAMEVARFNIRVALIEPGIILTPIFGKQKIPPLPVPAYEADYRRWGAFVQQRIRKRTFPSAVVAAVMDAIDSPTPRFRYPVGEDAELISAMRASVSDVEFLSAASGRTDDEYYDAMTQLVGTDLWRSI